MDYAQDFRDFLPKALGRDLEELKNMDAEALLRLIKRFNQLPKAGMLEYGVEDEIGKLRAVLVHRPGPEFELIDERNPEKWLMSWKPDVDRALEEYDELVRTIRRESGAEVIYLHEPWKGWSVFPVNQCYVRDCGFMTKEGFVAANPPPPREFEEFFTMRKLLELGVPVIFKVHSRGFMESGDIVYLDRETLLVGSSLTLHCPGYERWPARTNREGYEQLKGFLEGRLVKKVMLVKHREMHLDVVFNVASHDVAAACDKMVSRDFIKIVEGKGFEVIKVPEEEQRTLATNWLCMEPGKIVFVDGEDMNVKTRRALEKAGVDVVGVKMPNLLGGDGGPRCLTMPIHREPAWP